MRGWLIAFLMVGCLGTLYIVIGISVRYYSGLRHCPEVLPNYRFWCSILDYCSRVVTCGRCRFSPDRSDHASGIFVLPSRPGVVASARRVQFELLASDADDDYVISRAMQPAEVVVKY
ncbi:hypothetical protein LSCM1_05036 [Leishmania martiniquensis]|uniref:Transmembrane protein n=1 Tax=Leishmania martiniquensis TaxID=1580590 RepID=A0A836HA52_9TRYP|nr:hypothetical protein LSCM1_05036 [Leishmania martiniquensis]